MYVSLHRYTEGFYPGTGAAEETGTGPGRAIGGMSNALQFGFFIFLSFEFWM